MTHLLSSKDRTRVLDYYRSLQFSTTNWTKKKTREILGEHFGRPLILAMTTQGGKNSPDVFFGTQTLRLDNNKIELTKMFDGYANISVKGASYAKLVAGNDELKFEKVGDCFTLKDITILNPLFPACADMIHIETDGTRVTADCICIDNLPRAEMQKLGRGYDVTHFPSRGKVLISQDWNFSGGIYAKNMVSKL